LAMKSGYEMSNKLNARSWLDVGMEIEEDEVQLGDIVVFWRESIKSWKGHVGMFIKRAKSSTYVLGGNQMNQFIIRPYDNHKILGYRRLRKVQ